MKRRNWDQLQSERARIQKARYKLVQYTDVHWRAFKDNQACDIWPTSRKIMLRDGFWNVKRYTDIVRALNEVFVGNAPKPIITEAEKQTLKEYSEFRDDLQDKLKAMGL